MIKRVSITGPESSGKSTLSRTLSNHFNEPWVPEYARTYLKEKGVHYSLEDVESIARGQLLSESEYLKTAEHLMFCDTDMTVALIWCEVVFGHCPAWIRERQLANHYDLYLLCSPDLPWEPDPLRQNPNDRWELFERYRHYLSQPGFNVEIISGQGEERLKKAISFVNSIY